MEKNKTDYNGCLKTIIFLVVAYIALSSIETFMEQVGKILSFITFGFY